MGSDPARGLTPFRRRGRSDLACQRGSGGSALTPLCPRAARVGTERWYIRRAMNYAIEIERLDVSRGGQPVLHGLSARLEAGRVTGLLGPSGCGKTTLIRSIVGVQRVAGGGGGGA